MTSKATTVEEYLSEVAPDKKAAVEKLRKIIKKNIPKGFQETISYGMIGYVVPHTLYPNGYHCAPKDPLPFVNIAAQKNFIAVYHMCVYADPILYKWFTTEYPKHSKAKLDMGKSCIRFKKPADIPFDLIGELVQKVTVDEWIERYEKAFVKNKK
ncbi:MAG: hypothetical protein RL596_1162 [Bacteroidota bacterium]|jgi:uncharacterized protein YdhG (YjbR/CyaY superfamily)